MAEALRMATVYVARNDEGGPRPPSLVRVAYAPGRGYGVPAGGGVSVGVVASAGGAADGSVGGGAVLLSIGAASAAGASAFSSLVLAQAPRPSVANASRASAGVRRVFILCALQNVMTASSSCDARRAKVRRRRPAARAAATGCCRQPSFCGCAASAWFLATKALYSSGVSAPSLSVSASSNTWVRACTEEASVLVRFPSLSASRSDQVICFASPSAGEAGLDRKSVVEG